MISRPHEIYARVSAEKHRKISEFLAPRALTMDAFINAAIDRLLRGPIAKRTTRTAELP